MGRWNMTGGNENGNGENSYDSVVVYSHLFNGFVNHTVFNVAIFPNLDLIFHDADGSNATLLKTWLQQFTHVTCL